MSTRAACAVLAGCALHGCDGTDATPSRLASRCVQASGDPRVIHSASQLTDATVDVEGDRVTVRTRTPLGVGIDLKLRFREWTYRCRRVGDGLEFIGYERGEVVR